tara:strand:+ start:2670 stop:3530 length:861 start_codon:yes stop_codon:yes gene_type:complete
MSLGGGGGGTQTTRSEPSEIQRPYLEDVYRQAQSQFRAGPMQTFPGSYTAAPTASQLAAEDLLTGASQGQASFVANSLFPSFQNAIMSPAQVFSDPMLQQSLAAGIRPFEQGASRLLTQARRDANEAGQLGGLRRGLLESEVISDFLQKSSDTAANIYGKAFGDMNRTRAVTLGLAPQILSAFTAPAQTLMSVGNLQQARNQAAIDEARQKFEFAQQAPAAALNQYANIAAGNILPGSTTTTGGGGSRGGLQGALGGAATGASLASTLGFAGPYGAIAGGILGLLQ